MKPRLSAVAALLGVAGLGCLAAPAAFAQAMANARVLSATPIFEAVPVSQCPPGAYGQYGRYDRQPSGGGAAVGALVGGLIGSQLDNGSGHIAGAILGTLGGAALGNAAEAHELGRAAPCRTAYEQRLTGYDVRYRLAGQTLRTRTAQHPGAWLQVPVAAGYGQPALGANDYGGAVQTYPVTPPPVAAYPLPAYPTPGNLPPDAYGAYGDGYDNGYAYAPPPYPVMRPAPVYVQPAPVYMRPAPVYVRPAPVYVTPVGVSVSIGGRWGHHGHGGWGVRVGPGW